MAALQHFDLINKQFWRKKEYSVTAPNGQEIWIARLHSKHVDLRSGHGIQVATAKKHAFSSDIEISLAHSNTTTKLSRYGSRWTTTKSVFYRSETITWQRVSRMKDVWNFYDSRGYLIATFAAKLWDPSRKGTYDVFVPGLDQEMMELIVLLGIIELDHILAIQAAASG
jgi:hypothetical protein